MHRHTANTKHILPDISELNQMHKIDAFACTQTPADPSALDLIPVTLAVNVKNVVWL